MFQKDFKVKNNVKSKNSEKRKLIAEISQYYHIDQTLLINLIAKSDLHKIKIECHDETIITIYNFDDQPLFFELNKVIIPTVYCLWSFFDMIPSFMIHEETVPFIDKGSDLMIPGIITKKPLNEKSYGNFQKKQLYVINTNLSRAPIAVGFTNMDSYDMFMTGGRGKALNVIHVQGDYLWSFGKRNLRPKIEWQSETLTESDDEESIIDLIENKVDELMNNVIDSEVVSIPVYKLESEVENLSACKLELNDLDRSDTMDMNELLMQCFLHALKCSLKDKSLPITLNMLYANHVLRFCPDGVILEIKKTSFKKFGVFIKSMENEGLIKLKSINKGVEAIDIIDRNHDRLRFTPTLKFHEQKIDISDDEYVFPQIDEIFFITDKLYNIFRFYGFKKTDTISPKEIKSIITEYVNKHNLNGLNKDMVTLDVVLKSCCLNSKETITELSWKTLFERINKNMTPGIVLKFPNESVTMKNSKKPKIKIQSFNKNNKMVTRIEGEDKFCIDSKKLSYQIQQAIGCSCGLVTDKSGITAIQAQGDQRKRITDILTENFKVPLHFIDVAVTKKSK